MDGRPIVEDASEWSHMRLDMEVGMGHAHGCWGDCDKHGCPVPEPYQVQVECGPVTLRGSVGSEPCARCAGTGEYPPTDGDTCSFCGGEGSVLTALPGSRDAEAQL